MFYAKNIITVNDKMQKGYRYELMAPMGRSFALDFKPELSPKKMLELGVFSGVYMRDCVEEFPADWFTKAKFAKDKKDPTLNFFGVEASQSLDEWRKKGWIYKDDPRGWFQWYCRYYMGRRIDAEDKRQIKRWRAIKRHIMALKKNCRQGDIYCRPKQRQAILHWAYDSRNY